MVQIISDKPSNWITWVGEAVEHLQGYPVQRMIIVADIDNKENHNIIEFMNCSTDDVYRLGGVLQKEAIKHEMAEDFGLDDESWEEYEGEEDLYESV